MKWIAATALLTVASLALAAEPTPSELLVAATSRPWPGENDPVLPTLPTAMRWKIAVEINRPEIRKAFRQLDARDRTNNEWFAAVEALEKEQAVWSLQACLVHPHADVQIHAVRALGRLKDRRAVPFLLVYSGYMAVPVNGSENATIHDILQDAIVTTLSSITGIEVARVDGSAAQLDGPSARLGRGLRQWTKWLVEQPPIAS